MASLSDELETLKTKETTLTSNKVANFAYEDSAYEADNANGVDTYNYANAQNIPNKGADILTTNESVLLKGFRSQASSIPRMLLNHFLGRCSYNLNKVNDIMKSLLTAFKDYLGAANGIATLDENGRIPFSQLPESALEWKGEWNAETNTPELADGTGTKGDMYIVTVAGKRDLGSGEIEFLIGDRVIYSGSVWQDFPAGSVTSVNNIKPVSGNVALTGSNIPLSATKQDVSLNDVIVNGFVKPYVGFKWKENTSTPVMLIANCIVSDDITVGYSNTTNSKLYYTKDGINWTEISSVKINGADISDYYCSDKAITKTVNSKFYFNVYYTSGEDTLRAVVYSDDGINFSSITVADLSTFYASSDAYYVTETTEGVTQGKTFVLIYNGTENVLCYSEDGITFTVDETITDAIAQLICSEHYVLYRINTDIYGGTLSNYTTKIDVPSTVSTLVYRIDAFIETHDRFAIQANYDASITQPTPQLLVSTDFITWQGYDITPRSYGGQIGHILYDSNNKVFIYPALGFNATTNKPFFMILKSVDCLDWETSYTSKEACALVDKVNITLLNDGGAIIEGFNFVVITEDYVTFTESTFDVTPSVSNISGSTQYNDSLFGFFKIVEYSNKLFCTFPEKNTTVSSTGLNLAICVSLDKGKTWYVIARGNMDGNHNGLLTAYIGLIANNNLVAQLIDSTNGNELYYSSLDAVLESGDYGVPVFIQDGTTLKIYKAE